MSQADDGYSLEARDQMPYLALDQALPVESVFLATTKRRDDDQVTVLGKELDRLKQAAPGRTSLHYL